MPPTNHILYHIVMIQVFDNAETFLFHPTLEREADFAT